MTNKFFILWFEDDATWFTMESTKLKHTLQRTYGFQTEIEREIGIDYNPEELKSENKYDLILMDYQLAAGNTGEKFVNLIREDAILTDVILYSSHFSEMKDALIKSSPLINGVFLADRKSELFEDKVLAVINKIVRRSEDIVNLRGFFLDNTSDFEVRIKEILKLAWDKLPDQRACLMETMSEVLNRNKKRTEDNVDKIMAEEDIYNIANNDIHVLGIHNRLEVLTKIIKILASTKSLVINDANVEFRNFIYNYEKDISCYRNALSHKKYSDTSLSINEKVVAVDSKLHKQLRESVARYDFLIGFIEDFISSI